MHNYRDLNIWKKSISLTKEIYDLTSNFPKDEKYGINSQLKSASVSVPSNIAEGSSRESDKEFNHFLSIALGSLFELDTQLTIAKEIGYLNNSQQEKITNNILELVRMIIGFKNKIKSDI